MDIQKIKVVIDYNKTPEEMISGTKCEVNEDVTIFQKLPIVGVGFQEVELFLLKMERAVYRVEILRFMEIGGLKPAKIEHLLAFASSSFFEKLGEDMKIFAFGSGKYIGSEYTIYPSIYFYNRKKYLPSTPIDDETTLGSHIRFLAIKDNTIDKENNIIS